MHYRRRRNRGLNVMLSSSVGVYPGGAPMSFRPLLDGVGKWKNECAACLGVSWRVRHHRAYRRRRVRFRATKNITSCRAQSWGPVTAGNKAWLSKMREMRGLIERAVRQRRRAR